jgi:renalase
LDADVIVVGAGLTGLTAARHLEAGGYKTLVLDKGRSVGGRMATRRLGGGVADHGAQFFTVRSRTFAAEFETWQRSGLIFEWTRRLSDGSLRQASFDDQPRYAVAGGMNRLAKWLAGDLPDVRLEKRVAKVQRFDAGWVVVDTEGQSVTARQVIITAPVPQLLEMLAGASGMPEDYADALGRVVYASCLAGMFAIDGDVSLPEPGAIQDFGAEFSFIADNSAKRVSPDVRVITMHGSRTFSGTHWNDDDGAILARMQERLGQLIGPVTTIRAAELKRWLYAQPLITLPEDFLNPVKGLYLAGDAFGGRARVEGAVLSGLSTARAILGRDG